MFQVFRPAQGDYAGLEMRFVGKALTFISRKFTAKLSCVAYASSQRGEKENEVRRRENGIFG